VFEMRRHLSNYFKGIPDFKPYRLKLVTLTDPAEISSVLDEVSSHFGDLAPEATSVYF